MEHTKSEVQVRQFRVHSKLLYDVIRRQAGSLAKAVLEGVMNAADAGAKAVHIKADANSVELVDDGKGFRSREEITTFFEVFGQPHEEKEGKVFGAFRMGRGQLFSYGINTWRTGKWRMLVDILNKGLDYELHDESTVEQGCRIGIKLYDRLLPTDLLQLQRDLEMWCKYAPIQVTFNGKQVNVDPKSEKWEYETEDAYIRIRKTGGRLTLYNLGIHVMEMSDSRFGVAGVIVSKKQLKVNFARNDVQSDCPVWRNITKVLREAAGREIKKSPTLTEGGRQNLADRIKSEPMEGKDVLAAKVITTVQGRHVSVQQFMRNEMREFFVAPSGDRPAERAMDHKVAFAVAQETLERFDVSTGTELTALLQAASGYDWWPKEVAYELAVRAFKGKNEVLDTKKVSANSQAWLALAKETEGLIRWPRGEYSYENREENPEREILIGRSESADGWTDGRSYIAIAEQFLSRLRWDEEGFTRLGMLLVHEYVHRGSTEQGCDHDHDFYHQFHDKVRKTLPGFVAECVYRANDVLDKTGKKVTQQMARRDTQRVLIAEAKKKLDEVEPPQLPPAPKPAEPVPVPIALPPIPAAAPEAGPVMVPCGACGKQVKKTRKGLFPHNKAPGKPCEAAPRGGGVVVAVKPAVAAPPVLEPVPLVLAQASEPVKAKGKGGRRSKHGNGLDILAKHGLL